ncbi:MAG: AbrB/MazE/SpoVT family DNA-binding domain-containing protein [Oscillospiraceae bacterium]|nr:AbrB/MazE/SpoVT family DNA-binding domain-containing protein [Oscillospiraceae bacterium]
MKATGIVRRIDDLGRVVIPKELRRTMRLREGAPLEIFTDKGGELIFKKYSPIGELSDFAADLCESLRRVSDAAAAVCDRDGVIAVAGASKKELTGRAVSAELGELMEKRAFYRRSSGAACVPVCEGAARYAAEIAAPILCEGDVVGAVLFLAAEGAKSCGETEEKLARAAAHFLGRQMEG